MESSSSQLYGVLPLCEDLKTKDSVNEEAGASHSCCVEVYGFGMSAIVVTILSSTLWLLDVNDFILACWICLNQCFCQA